MPRRLNDEGQLSESPLSTTKIDDLGADILAILKKHAGDGEGSIYAIDIKDLLVDLSIYIVSRDHKILQHGIDLGRNRQRELSDTQQKGGKVDEGN